METNPFRFIRTAWELACRRTVVRQHMEQRYRAAPRDTWDVGSVPKGCHHQAFLATKAYLEICSSKKSFDDTMLEKLIGNLKLLTVTFQEIKRAEARQLFLNWKFPGWPGAQFNYTRESRDVVWWVDHKTP